MKFLAAVFLLSLSPSLLADEHDKPFDQLKEQKLSNIDKRMTYLNELKSCVTAATNKETVKSCHDAHGAKMQTMMENHKSWKEAKKEERKSKRKKK